MFTRIGITSDWLSKKLFAAVVPNAGNSMTKGEFIFDFGFNSYQ